LEDEEQISTMKGMKLAQQWKAMVSKQCKNVEKLYNK